MTNHNEGRREFIKLTGAAGIAATILPSISGYAAGIPPTGFTQQPLGYSYNALEPTIDAMTMEIHYSKHAAAYAKNLADAIKEEKIDTSSKALEDILRNVSAYSGKIRNNGGGHYNHELFWQCMKPGGANTASGKLATAIDQSFGSFESFKTQFFDAGKNRFGSGWAWLVMNTDKKLAIGSTPNQDNPLMNISELKGTPLLCMDVWEHAYYLKYQNKRPDYISNWWKLVNWDYVAERYRKV